VTRNASNILVGELEETRTFLKLRHRWESNTGKDLTEVGWKGLDWMQLAQDS
jgi:hypothetical protein